MHEILNPSNASHPIAVHFPIALFFISLVLDALGMLRARRHEKMGKAARTVYLAIGLAGGVVLSIAGHYGGRMVYGA